MKQKVGNMPRINEATDMDSCLIIAEPAPYLIQGTSLKWIERLQYLGWKGEIHCFIIKDMPSIKTGKDFSEQ